MPFVSETIAKFAVGLRYEDLPSDAVAATKRFLVDSVGCALGGLSSEDCHIMRGLLDDLGGNPQCTIIGGGRSDAVRASLMNALLVRVMDYNDIYWKQDPSHPSDIIPASLAMGELRDKSGRDVIVSIVLAYEFEMRLCEAAFPGVRERGWHHATLTQLASPIAAGVLNDLSWEQLQHAMGISGSHNGSLGAVTAGHLTMMKNTVDPMATSSGVEAALMAERGYTGPEHVFDGKEGLYHCMGPDWKPEIMTDGLGESFRITECGMKAYPTEALTHAPVSCTLKICEANGIQAEDVAQITIRSTARAADILADPSKYEPETKETADHSLPYIVAAAVADRNVTPLQFTDEKIHDPRIRSVIGKVKVVGDDECERLFPDLQRNYVTVETTDGRSFDGMVDYPKGDPRDPMTEAEVEAKYRALAEMSGVSADHQDAILAAVDGLDASPSARELMGVLSLGR